MRLLLLLSALLAALSGAAAGARAPQAQSVAVATRTPAAPAVQSYAHVLAAAPAAHVRGTLAEPVQRTTVLLPAPRLWASRRRE